MQGQGWRRRDALLLGAFALGGCGVQRGAAPAGSPSQGVRPAATSGSPTTSPSATSPHPSGAASPSAGTPSGPTAVVLPTKAEILERFGSARPKAFGLDVPGVVSRLPRTADAVALTFDACGGPGGGSGVDAALLATLRRLQVPATLFLNLRWIKANASLARDLAQDPLFELANHGRRHCPLTVRQRAAYGIRGTTSAQEVFDEIDCATAWFVENTGGPPRWFRAGTAHVDDVAAAIARAMGQPIAGFTVNADAGATAPRRAIIGAMAAVHPGDIVIGHMNRPDGSTAEGMASALPRLLARGVNFTHLTIS